MPRRQKDMTGLYGSTASQYCKDRWHERGQKYCGGRKRSEIQKRVYLGPRPKLRTHVPYAKILATRDVAAFADYRQIPIASGCKFNLASFFNIHRSSDSSEYREHGALLALVLCLPCLINIVVTSRPSQPFYSIFTSQVACDFESI